MIRSFRLRDSLLVARLQRGGTPLDIEEQLTHPRSPLRSVLLSAILYPRSGPSTFILDQQDDNGRQLGLAQMRHRPGRPEQDVVFMSPALDAGNGTHAIWQRLLTHLSIQTAERGSLRLYARLPLQGDELQLFKAMGFLEYGQEEIYRLNQPLDPAALQPALELRPQQPSDGWGLQKLYATVAPRVVQNAEGLAQAQWDLTPWHWGEQGRRDGYMWESNGELLAALHIRTGKCGYLIRTLLHPDALDQAEELIKAALSLISTQPHLPVFFTFRQYEAGWQNVLPGLGFEALTCQGLVVKHMAVRVRQKSPALMAALEKSPTEGAAPSAISHSETEPVAGSRRHYRQKTYTLL